MTARPEGDDIAATPFVIMATQRSGSSMLVRRLDAHPEITCFSELFLRGADRREIAHPRYSQFTAGARRGLPARVRPLTAYLDGVFAVRRDGAVGFKMQYNQYRRHPTMGWQFDRRGVSVVHLVRDNVLRSYVSYLSAAQSGVFHATSGDDVTRPVVLVDCSDLLRQLRARADAIERYRRRVARHRHLEVGYPQVAKPEGLAPILDFLGLSAIEALPADLVRLGADDLRNSIRNYDEVERTLRGTAFERHLS